MTGGKRKVSFCHRRSNTPVGVIGGGLVRSGRGGEGLGGEAKSNTKILGGGEGDTMKKEEK